MLPGQTEPWQLCRVPSGWMLGVLHPWAGGAASTRASLSLPLQQATRGDGLAFQARTGMLP